ncbi:MAG: L,D-transpeptidase family protein [Campylobacterota bacterium]|nr:L,D-transpeptidase family protein [Campylobacterota bacterium]
MKILILILISLSLHANEVLTNYRINGITEIEKKMDLKLTKKEYWSEYLKNRDTSFGYIEAYSSLLTCDKSNSTLQLYKQDENSTFRFKKEYNAFTGKKQGDKIMEGDLKTPVGIYRITKKIQKLDSFYGPLAFVTSYPNSYDKFRGKNGHGIWIHGLPTHQIRDEFTKGCIAINNSNIKCLDKRINIEETLLIINEKKTLKNSSKDILSSILSQLFLWRYSWLYSDIDTYLEFYSNDFIKNDKMNLNRFKKYKTRIFQKNEKKTIIFNNINIIPYPNTLNIYQITFKEFYQSKNFQFEGKKTLMVRLNKNNKIKIFTEK